MKKFLLSVLLCFSFLSVPVHAETTESNPYNKSQTARQYKNNFEESPFYKKIMEERKNFYSAGTGGKEDNKAMRIFLDVVDTAAQFTSIAKYFSIPIGLAFMVKILYDMRLFASDGRAPKYSPFMCLLLLILSACIMNLPQSINTLSATLFDGQVCASRNYVSCANNITADKGELYNASKKIMSEELVDSIAFVFFKGIIFLASVFGFIMFFVHLITLHQMGSGSYKGNNGPWTIVFYLGACALLVDTEHILILLFNWFG